MIHFSTVVPKLFRQADCNESPTFPAEILHIQPKQINWRQLSHTDWKLDTSYSSVWFWFITLPVTSGQWIGRPWSTSVGIYFSEVLKLVLKILTYLTTQANLYKTLSRSVFHSTWNTYSITIRLKNYSWKKEFSLFCHSHFILKLTLHNWKNKHNVY